MRHISLALVASTAMLAACAQSADPWVAAADHAADAPAGGGPTLLRNYYAFDESCVAVAPPLEIVRQGALGEASVGVATETLEDPEDECDGSVANGAGVYYEAASGVSGVDVIAYREFGEGGRPDRIHTMRVRVR